mgnify:FL=1
MIHHAGTMTHEGVQRCVRCGEILTDYRNSQVLDGTPPMRGWASGASVEVQRGNPSFSSVVTAAPDCRPV